MSGPKKTLRRVLSEAGDANISFDDLRSMLRDLGFSERTRGSHHIFWRAGIRENIVLARSGSQVKPYQVRRIRTMIRAHGLHLEES